MRKTPKPPYSGKPNRKPSPAKGAQRPKSGDRANATARRTESKPFSNRDSGKSRPTVDKPKIRADLFGLHAVQEAWLNPKRNVHALYITEAAQAGFKSTPPAGTKRPPPTIVTKEDLDRAFPQGTVHQGVALSCQPLEEYSLMDVIIAGKAKPRSVILILDQVTDPHNVGAILRSACAFGADGVILQSRHAPEMTGVLAKTACGAVEHLPIAYEINLSRSIETLQNEGYTVIGLDEHAQTTFSSLPSYDRAALVLGAEGSGMRRLIREHCDVLVTLPTKPPIASLNVSNAAAVALYALCA